LQDHLGSTTALTNSSGSIIESASYDSFGNSTNNLSTRYQFTGREYDSDIGLQYSRARWYDATIGRFISEDPIGFGGGDVNLFGYVGNNSQNFVDPSGNFPFFFSPNLPMNNKSPHQPNRNLDCVDKECKKDIEDMVRDMENVRDEMNSDGRRVPNASEAWNNVRASFNGVINSAAAIVGSEPVVDDIQGCIGQSACLLERVYKKQPKNYKYEIGRDLLGLKDVGDLPITTHKWVKAFPKNPKCPKVRIDSWDNNWEILK
jgi:RHS repeat-associated protein